MPTLDQIASDVPVPVADTILTRNAGNTAYETKAYSPSLFSGLANEHTARFDGTNWVNVTNNLSGTAAPGPTNDSSEGYSIGSVWIDTVANLSYVCVDATATSAVWDAGGGGGGVSTWLDLTDTDPLEYLTFGGQFVRVNLAETGLEFVAGGGTDSDAVHDNVAGEIALVTEKATPVAADLFLIEDSADSDNKKRVQMGSIDHDALTNYAAGEHLTPGAGLGTSGSSVVLDLDNMTAHSALTDSDVMAMSDTILGTRNITWANVEASIGIAASQVTSGTLAIAQGGTASSTAITAFDALSPMTTEGDIIVQGAATNERLPIGTAGQVLTVAAGGLELEWATGGGGGGSMNDLIDDTTPQLGGMLDVNGWAIGTGTFELITFTEIGSAVNNLNVTNAATGNAPLLGVGGGESDIGMYLMDSDGAELLQLTSITGAAAINYLEIESAIAGTSGPIIRPSSDAGTSADVNLNLEAKGTGIVNIDGNELLVPILTGAADWDILRYDTSLTPDTYVNFAMGLADEYLKVNATATGLEYAGLDVDDATAGTLAIARGGTGQTAQTAAFNALSPNTTEGDIIYRDGVGDDIRLPAGTDSHVLTLSSGVPIWSSPGAPAGHDILSASHTDATSTGAPTAGDILYANATPLWDRLPRGTDNQYLAMAGTVPTWQAMDLGDATDGTGTNAKLADMAAWTLKMRNNAGSGVPQDVGITGLSVEANPAALDFIMLERADGTLAYADIGDLPGSGSNTLDQAYNEGGLGLGRTINATDGAVLIRDITTVAGTLVLNVRNDVSGTLTAKTTNVASITGERAHTAATTVNDDYNALLVHRHDESNNASADLNSAGSVLRVTRDITNTQGTVTDSVVLAELEAFAAADPVFDVRVQADSFARYAVDVDGDTQWGSGAAAADIQILRSGAGQLDVASTDGTPEEICRFIEGAGTNVNYVEIESEVTTASPIIRAAGSDTDVGLEFQTQNAGEFTFNGEALLTTNIAGVATDDLLQYDGADWANVTLAAADIAIASRTLTVAGTPDQIDSSAGAQDLTANRTWTIALADDPIIPTGGDLATDLGIRIPVKTTSGDPSGGVAGRIYYNSNTDEFRGYGAAWGSLGSGGGGGSLNNIVEDVTPQLGAMLDVNTFGIGDGTNLLIDFVEDASATSWVEIENENGTSGPIIRAAGAANSNLNLAGDGTGVVNIDGNDVVPSVITGAANGDVVYYSSGSSAFINLAAGTNGHVLTLSAGVPIWSAGGGEVNNLETVCTNILDNELVIGTGTDTAAYVDETTLTSATVGSTDYLVGWTNAGLLRRFTVSDLPAGGEVNNLETSCENILSGEIPVGTGTDVVTYTAATGTGAPMRGTTPTLGTSLVLDQTSFDYTLTWADPGAARAISISDPGGTDVFAWVDASQTLTNKTIAAGSNTLSGLTHGSEVDNPSSGVHGVTGSVVGTTDTQTLSAKTLTSPIVGTQLTLDQTTADYTITWADPAAGRALDIIDPGGADTFVFEDATQTLTNKTIAAGSNTITGLAASDLSDGIPNTRTITVAATSNETTVAEGAQDLSANRTFTVGIADDAVLPPNGTGTLGFTWPIKTDVGNPAISNGRAYYNSFSNQFLVCENGAWASITGGGAETNDLESVATSAGDNEVFVGTGVDAGTYIALPASGEVLSFDGSTFSQAAATDLANMNADSILGNDSASGAAPQYLDETTLTSATVGSTDYLVGWTNAGLLRRFTVSDLPAGGEVNNLETDCENIEDNEVFVGTGPTGTGTYIALNTNGAVSFNGTAFAQAASTDLSDVTALDGTGSTLALNAGATLTTTTLTSPTINGTIATTGLTVPALTLSGNLTRAADQTIDLTGAATRTLTLQNSTGSQVSNLDVDGRLLFRNNTAFTMTLDGTPTVGSQTFTLPDLAAASSDVVLCEGTTQTITGKSIVATQIDSGTLPIARIAAGDVTLDKLADFAPQSILLRETGTGAPAASIYTDIAIPGAASAADWVLGWDSSGVIARWDANDFLTGGGGNTLDSAYDQGGAGAGRTIEAEDGAVLIRDNTTLAGNLVLNVRNEVPGASNITAQTEDIASISAIRDSRSGNITDDFNTLLLRRDNTVNGGGITYTCNGSVLRLQNDTTVTLGNLTDNVVLLELDGAAAADPAIDIRINDEANARFAVDTDGDMTWGPGGATAVDTTLTRTAAGVLDLADILDVNTGLRVAGAAATGNVLRGNGTNFISATLDAADLANIKEYALLGNAGAGAGGIAELDELDVTTDATPGAGDFLLGWLSTGELRKFDIDNLPGGGEANNLETICTGITANEIPVGGAGVVTYTASTGTGAPVRAITPTMQTSIVLDQTTEDYTLTWADPAAARAISIPDPGGTDVFLFADAAQTITGKTINGSQLVANSVAHAAVADFVANSVFLRGATGGVPSDAIYTDVPTEGTPVGTDFILGWDDTGVLNKYAISTLPAGSETNTLSTTCTGIAANEVPVGSGADVATYTATTGTGSVVRATAPTITTPIIATIDDTNGNEMVSMVTTASAVTNVEITNAISAGAGPLIRPTGETNVNLRLAGAGTGVVNIDGNDVIPSVVTTPADGDVMTYASGSSSFVNETLAAADIAIASRTLDINSADGTIDVDLAGPLDLTANRAWDISIADSAVTLAMMANVKEYSLIGKDTAGSGAPLNLDELDLPTEAAPTTGDWILGWDAGLLVKYDVGTLPAGSETNNLETVCTGITANEIPVGGAGVVTYTASTGTGAPVRAITPTMQTSIVLDQTTEDYTLTWADPGAARAISIADPGGTDVFAWVDASQTLTNKTITAAANTLTLATTDLSDVTTSTGSGTSLVFATTPTLSSPTLTTPRILTTGYIASAAGDPYITFVEAASTPTNSVEIQVSTAAGSPAQINGVGSANAGLILQGAGTGTVEIIDPEIAAAEWTNANHTHAGATTGGQIAISDTTGTLAETRGGTGAAAYTQGDILYSDATNSLARLPAGTDGDVLGMGATIPAWKRDMKSKSFCLDTPVSPDLYGIFSPDVAITVREITGICEGGTNCSFSVEYAATITAAGTVIDTVVATTSLVSGGSISVAVAADQTVSFNVTAQTGNPNSVLINVMYTED